MAQKWLVFTSKSPTPWHYGLAHALFSIHLYYFDGRIAMEEQRPSLETPMRQTNDRRELLGRTSSHTKSAVEPARRLETARNLFVVMRVCSRLF